MIKNVIARNLNLSSCKNQVKVQALLVLVVVPSINNQQIQ